VGELGLWFAAIAGTLTLIGITIYDKTKDKANIRFFLVKEHEKDKIPEYKELLRDHYDATTSMLLDEGSVKKIAYGSLPLEWDMAFDVVVVAIMLFFDYAWLPLFYIIHMYGLYLLRTKVLRFYEEAKYFNPEDYKEGGENA
jgi:hypothetical protein